MLRGAVHIQVANGNHSYLQETGDDITPVALNI